MKKFINRLVRTWTNQMRIFKLRKNNHIGNHVFISRDSIVGKGCRIGDNVKAKYDVKIGNNVKIGTGAILERISIGDNSIIEGRVVITGHGKGRIVIGKESFVGHLAVLDFSDNISIGDNVHIGYSHFWTHSSALMCINGLPLKENAERYRPTKPITIEDCVYVGVHCTIYPGVTIGHHSIIAPNSVVAHDVPPYSMVGGTPAKVIKSTKDMIGGDWTLFNS